MRNFSNALEDISVYSESEPSPRQLEQLEGITKSCNNLIQNLQKSLDRYTEVQPNAGVGRLPKRAWKKLTWEPSAINDLRTQIGVNLELVNVFLAKLNRHDKLSTMLIDFANRWQVISAGRKGRHRVPAGAPRYSRPSGSATDHRHMASIN